MKLQTVRLDGTPSIGVTDLKSGSNFYQKHPSGFYGIARVEHDAAKAFGTTYYGFGMILIMIIS